MTNNPVPAMPTILVQPDHKPYPTHEREMTVEELIAAYNDALARVAVLEKAIKPFAEFGGNLKPHVRSSYLAPIAWTAGQYRAAHTAYEGVKRDG